MISEEDFQKDLLLEDQICNIKKTIHLRGKCNIKYLFSKLEYKVLFIDVHVHLITELALFVN